MAGVRAWGGAYASALLIATVGARSATPPDTDWPCDAPLKPALVPAEIWGAAATPAARDWRSEPDIIQLVNEVAPRNVPMSEASRRVYGVAQRLPPAARGRIAAGLIETIDVERRLIVAGILRFNDRQQQLARRIEQGYKQGDASHDESAAHEESAGEAQTGTEDQLRWDTRIFEDRQRMLPIICRQPAALEARLAGLIAAVRAPPALASTRSGEDYLVYVTNEGSGDISIIDPAAAREIGRIAIGKRPRGLVASPDGTLLYVAVSGSPAAGPGVDETTLPPPDRAADGIVVIDLARRKVLRTVKGVTDPEQIAISPDGARLYVASEDSGQLVIIGSDGRVLGTNAIGGEPEGVTVSADGSTILATSEADHSIAVLRGLPLAHAALHLPQRGCPQLQCRFDRCTRHPRPPYHRDPLIQSFTQYATVMLESAQAALSADRLQPRGSLRIDLPVVFGRRWVMPILLDMAKRYPELSMVVTFTDRRIDPIDEGVDLVLRIGDLEDSATLIARQLGYQRSVLCASPTYLARRGTPASLDDLEAHACIALARGGQALPWWFADESGALVATPVSGRLTFNDAEAIAEAVSTGRA